MNVEQVYIPPFSLVRLHYGGRDTETFTPGSGRWRVLRFGSIVAMQGPASGEVWLVSKETEAKLMDRVVRVVLPDGVHELTDDMRALLRFMDQAGVIVLHRDDREGVCFDLLPPAGTDEPDRWAHSVERHANFNAVVGEPDPDQSDLGYMGYHPVGSDCARKLKRQGVMIFDETRTV